MLVIGIAGGAGSGKTTVVRKILQSIDPQDVAVLSQDAYYRDSSDVPPQERQRINVDHPDSIEFELLARHVAALKRGEAVEEPTYSYTTYQRGKETVHVEPRPVILVEGILVLQNEALRKLMDLKVSKRTTTTAWPASSAATSSNADALPRWCWTGMRPSSSRCTNSSSSLRASMPT